jgi:TfoX/Sxy family transcriptional regulator of competence genes
VSGWTNGTNTYQSVLGKFGITDERAYFGIYSSTPLLLGCDTVARLYCFED